MKGVVLAGGTGSRLYPLTRVVNKHLLPVGNKPMIFYPLETLRRLGVDEVLIVTGGERSSCGSFMELIGNGSQFGFSNAYYAYQEGNGGIADALRLAREFTGDESFVCILGDNIFRGKLDTISEWTPYSNGASVVLYRCDNPSRYAVPTMRGNIISRVDEKPANPVTDLAVIGLYFFDRKVYKYIDELKPSSRGEYEITDVNNSYARAYQLNYSVYTGQWVDAGTHESIRDAGVMASGVYGRQENTSESGPPEAA